MQRFQQMHWSSVKRWNVPSSFIPSKNSLSISWAPLTVLTGYSRPTDGKEAKPSTPVSQACTQDDLQAEAVSTWAMATLLYLQGMNRALNGDHIQIKMYLFLFPALFYNGMTFVLM